ncbi:MAG: DinB family protein [Balneolaceae bacterium]
MSKKPYRSEYGDYYAGYIENLPDHSLNRILPYQNRQFLDLLSNFDNDNSLRRYAPGKWSLKEILGHLTDTELIFQYRALCIARGDLKSIPGYDHEAYVINANFDEIHIDLLTERIRSYREVTISLFQSFSPAQLMRSGIVNGNPFSVRAIGFAIAGHELHHMNVIRQKYVSLI